MPDTTYTTLHIGLEMIDKTYMCRYTVPFALLYMTFITHHIHVLYTTHERVTSTQPKDGYVPLAVKSSLAPAADLK